MSEAEGQSRKKSVEHRTIKSLFWMLSGTAGASVLNIVVLAILARLLSVEDFGVVQAAMVVVLFTDLFSHIGVGPAVVQRADLTERHIRSGFTFSLLFGILSMIALLILAPAIAAFFRMPGLTPIVQAMSIAFPFTGIAVVAEGLIQKRLDYGKLSAINLASFALGYGIPAIAMAVLGYGAWALAMGVVAQRILRSVMLLVATAHAIRLDWHPQSLRELLGFGLGSSIGDVLNFVALQGDQAIIGRYLGEGALGVYGRAYGLMAVTVKAFGAVLDKVMFSAMSLKQDDPAKLKLGYTRGLSLVALTLLPTSVVSMALAPEIIYLLLGPQWTAAIVPFQLLAVGMLFRVSYKLSTALAKATGNVYRIAPRQGLYAALVLIGTYAGAMRNGVDGAAAGVLVALFVHFVVMAQLGVSILREMTWSDFVQAHVPALCLAAVTGAAAWGVERALHEARVHQAITLAAGLLAAGAAAAIAISLLPKLMLGRDGAWIADTMLGYAPKRLPLVRDYRNHLRRRLALDAQEPLDPVDLP